MSVSAINTSSYISQSPSATRQDLQALQQALGNNDLSSAQDAFAAFKNDFHAAHRGRNLMQTHVPLGLKQDLQDLQSALNSGDLTAAQQAFSTIQQDVQKHGRHIEPPQSAQPEISATTGIDVSA